MSKRRKAILSLIFVMVVWGSSFTVTKTAVGELPPVYFAFLRFVVASVILLAGLFFRPLKVPLHIPWRIVLVMAVTGVTLYYIFFNLSLKYTQASTGALLEGFMPVFIALLAAVFLKEKLSSRQLSGIMISVAGVILVGFISLPKHGAPNAFTGNLLMTICIVLWAAYTILSKKVAAFDPLTIITFTTVFGTILLFPAVLVELNNKSWPMPSATGWLAIIYLGAIGSSLCYFLYSKAMEELTAAQVGNFLNLDPVTGAVLAVIFLHEKITLLQIVGCVLILAGVWLSTRKSSSTDSV